jgi:hypothetical protein
MMVKLREQGTGMGAARGHGRIRRIVAVSLCVSGLVAVTSPSSAQEPIRRFAPIGLRPGARPGTSPGSAIAHPELLAAAEANHSWEALAGSMKLGRKVRVSLKDSTVARGELLAIDSRSITVRQAGAPRMIQATDVQQVRYATHRSRNTFLLTLAASGGFAWAADRTSSHPSSPEESITMGITFLGLPIGGVAAAVVHDRALYEAVPRPSTP